MNRSKKPCKDCPKICTGTRCRACDMKYRATQPRPKRKNKPAPRTREPRITLAEKYPVPEPSPDFRPLTRSELEEAVCAQVDTEIFFVGKGGAYGEAMSVCHGCPIASRCLSANLDVEFGFVGGATPPQRRRIARALGRNIPAMVDDESEAVEDEAA